MLPTGLIEKATTGIMDVVNYISKSESSYFNPEAFSEMDCISDLQSGNDERRIVAMKKIWAHLSCGGDVSNLFSEVVRNAITDNSELRRLIHLFLVAQSNLAANDAKARAAIQELGLLAVNAFRKELSDRSQVARAATLRSMSVVRVLEIAPVLLEALARHASDASGFVRRSVAVACAQLLESDPDQLSFCADILSKLLGDNDPSVAGAAVSGLLHAVTVAGSLSQADGGESARECLGRLHKALGRVVAYAPRFEPPHQVAVCELLTLYVRAFFPSPFVRHVPTHATAAAASAAPLPALHPHLQPIAAALTALLYSSSSAAVVAAASAILDIFDAPHLAEAQLGAAAAQVVRDLSNFANPIAPLVKSSAVALVRTLRICPRGETLFVVDALHRLAHARPELLRPEVRALLPGSSSRDCHAVRLARLALVGVLLDASCARPVLAALEHEVKATQARLIIPSLSQGPASPTVAGGKGGAAVADAPLPSPAADLRALPHFVDSALEYLQALLRLIATTAVRVPSARRACLDGLIALLDSPAALVAAEAVVAIRTILQQLLVAKNDPSAAPAAANDSAILSATVVRQISIALPRLTSAAARASAAWLIGAHAADLDLPTAAEALRVLAANLQEETAAPVRLQTLHLAVRLFALVLDVREGRAAPAVVASPGGGPDPSTLLRVELLARLVVKLCTHDRALVLRDLARPLVALTMTPQDAPDAVKALLRRTVRQLHAGGLSMASMLDGAGGGAANTYQGPQGPSPSSLVGSVCSVRHAAPARTIAAPRAQLAYDPSGAHPPDSVRCSVPSAGSSGAVGGAHVTSMGSGHVSAHARAANATSLKSGGVQGGNRLGGAAEKEAIRRAGGDPNSFFEDEEEEDQAGNENSNNQQKHAQQDAGASSGAVTVSMATPPLAPQAPPAAPPAPAAPVEAPAFNRDMAAAASFFDDDDEEDAQPIKTSTPAPAAPAVAAVSAPVVVAQQVVVAGGLGGLGEGEEDEE